MFLLGGVHVWKLGFKVCLLLSEFSVWVWLRDVDVGGLCMELGVCVWLDGFEVCVCLRGFGVSCMLTIGIWLLA